MRLLILPITIALAGPFYGCGDSNDYSIERSSKIIAEGNDCRIAFNYPVFISSHQRNGITELNELLSEFPDYKYYEHNCERQKGKKLVVTGDYTLTLKTPNLLSIEFFTTIDFDGNRRDTVYHSVVINPKEIDERNGIISTPEMLFKDFNRKHLYAYVKAFNEGSKNEVNLLAYEKDSNYAITWGIANDKLLLYVGGEGEGFGNHRIKVPLPEIGR